MTKRKPRRKQKAPELSTSDRLEDLVEIAHTLSLPDDAFDGELHDACDEEAELIFENLKSGGLYERLEFLHLHGFELDRLAELIRELAAEDKK